MNFFAFLFATSLFASTPSSETITSYLEFLTEHAETLDIVGNAEEGEIQLLKTPEQMIQAAQQVDREIGVVYRDRYWIWINDPVLFPSGKLGVYGRIVTKSSLQGIIGCAVIPRFSDGKIALNCNYRHATRSWELEIPRGMAQRGESAEECAKRETLEETGLIASQLFSLGEMALDTGMSSSIVPIFLAEIAERGLAEPEDSEAISSVELFTLEEIQKALRAGSLSLEIRGKEKQVFLRDPFLTFGLLQMQVRGL